MFGIRAPTVYDKGKVVLLLIFWSKTIYIGDITFSKVLSKFNKIFKKHNFFFVVGQLHEDAPTEEHLGNLTILLS